MIKKIQQDFSYYSHEFKDNYRKGVHRLRTILANRAQAQAFVSNAGGVAVVLGYEPSAPDKNAQELYALLAASPYIDDAVQTFLGSIYEAGAESQDAMYSDSARCLEILHDPVMARAAGAGAVSAGKWIATLAGQSCNLYRDMNAVAASDIAMTAVAASETAMEAVISSTIALNAVAASKTAMTAVAANETAMVAVAASRVAMSAIIGNSTALNAVVTSSVAMTAVINNAAALNAVVSSSTAMAAIASSQTAMAAIASSQTAMAAVATSDSAIRAMVASTAAKTALIANNNNLQSVANTWWKTVQSGFTLVRSQKDDDGVTSANSVNAKYIMFAIPGGYNNGSGITNCFHGHNGAAAGSASGSYTDTAKRKVLLGGGTFTETNDGMVRTWVYSI
nr:MAG TPA: Tail fiber protein [Caudoviricetes sp.]